MKVLIIANYRQGVGGISSQVELLHNHLLEDGIDSSIFSTKGKWKFRLKQYVSLFYVASRYDLLHIHCCSGTGFLPAMMGVTVGKLWKKKIVLTYHGGDAEAFFQKRKSLVRFFLTRTDTNIVLSGFLGNVFAQNGIPYLIIPNVLDSDGSHFRKRTTISPNYLCIRSHTPIYNIPCIVNAFVSVKKYYPNASLTFVGDGPLHEELKALAATKGLTDARFVGRVPNSEIYSYLDKADVMLSSPIIDNMPVSLLEGFNAGLLVISSNVGGVPYMVRDGYNGLLFESDNSSQLAEKMIEAVENVGKTIVMIDHAHASLSNYTWAGVRPKLYKVYGIE